MNTGKIVSDFLKKKKRFHLKLNIYTVHTIYNAKTMFDENCGIIFSKCP